MANDNNPIGNLQDKVVSLSITDVDWYKIHSFAIKHERSIPNIISEFDKTIDGLLKLLSKNKDSGEETLKPIKEYASLIETTSAYVKYHGEDALDQAENMYIFDQAKSDV